MKYNQSNLSILNGLSGIIGFSPDVAKSVYSDSWSESSDNLQDSNDEIKLHLGCGNKNIAGFTNIDVRYQPGVDEINNVKFLRNYKSNSVDLIYASHVLEHMNRWEYKTALKRWYDILKPGAKIRIAVPNFDAIIEVYNRTGDLRTISGLLYGGQDYDQNFHMWCWNFNELCKDLEEVGFVYPTKYRWQDTEHAYIDDFSQAYYPHMDKENGILMSLNVEAIKFI